MSHGTAIARSVLSDQVKDRLLRAILDGRFPPGSRIVETRAAREFGTSQAPVREALRDLEALGVVEITPFHGARVRRPSTNELLEAFVVRSALETLAVRLAVPRLHEADLERLRSELAQMHAAVTRDDLHAEAEADARFHERLVRIPANGALELAWRRLEPSSRTYITLKSAAHGHVVADLHGPILDALERRDAEAAEEAMRVHFVKIEALLRASLGAHAEVTPDEPPRPRTVTRSPARRRRRLIEVVAQPSQRPRATPAHAIERTT